MKKIVLAFFIVGILSCKTASLNSISDNSKISFTVYKITSVKNYNLIYARRNDSIFKIVSKKNISKDCNKIKINEIYDFKLQSILKNRFKNTKFKAPVNYLDINCFIFEGDVKICKEKGIYDLYYTENLNGLCYTR
ncbi:hypothetical protein NAT51_19520 [Flavobacterium amniphilum]|uniref:hypothetical protein n=1 Tax=Flavobacterium amniphilum TaxID=1834035 RepID=UPI002029ED8A|nr:hypothetical protein [Flavobacterium amniphilum]MCL9807716.1 hypothetical protein [Flavobacterium amniphilum]